MANVDKGIDLWESIATTLNQIVKDTGKIEKDNPTIWQGYLHIWTNEDWENVFAALNTVYQRNPDVFTTFNERKLTEANSVFKKSSMLHTRCMDRKTNKTYAWSTIMLMREVWNQIHSLDVPFVDTAKKTKRKPIEVESDDEKTTITIFHNLFEIQ
jgi:hypothetical protein